MSDNLTKAQRRKNMQAIKSSDTSIEIMFRKALWKAGIRYRKNAPHIIGRPDIAVTKYKIAIFCDSNFWHGYNWETSKLRIKSNQNYWISKIEGNMLRDEKVNEALRNMGWIVIRFWEHDIRKSLSKCVEGVLSIIDELRNTSTNL